MLLMDASISALCQILLWSLSFSWQQAEGVVSAELFHTGVYKYGRFEARIQMPPRMGVIGGFFLWQLESQWANTHWYELDIERMGYGRNGRCQLQANVLEAHGNKPPDYKLRVAPSRDVCHRYAVYKFEWTKNCIHFFINGWKFAGTCTSKAREFRRSQGMRMHFNIWQGNRNFGGNLNYKQLPIYMFIDWVRYSSWDGGKKFTRKWTEKFDGPGLPARWGYGEYPSPFGKTHHSRKNVFFTQGVAVLALTADGHDPGPNDIGRLTNLNGGATVGSNGTFSSVANISTPAIGKNCNLVCSPVVASITLLIIIAVLASGLVAVLLRRSWMNVKQKVPNTDAVELLAA